MESLTKLKPEIFLDSSVTKEKNSCGIVTKSTCGILLRIPYLPQNEFNISLERERRPGLNSILSFSRRIPSFSKYLRMYKSFSFSVTTDLGNPDASAFIFKK